MSIVAEGQVKVDPVSSIRGFGRQFGEILDDFGEPVDNAWDADATKVTIELTPTGFTITDNGHGMGRQELESMMTRVGRSSKVNRLSPKGRPMRGMKAHGFWVFLDIGGRCEVWTRQELVFAREHSSSLRLQEEVPIYTLYPPSNQELEGLKYKIFEQEKESRFPSPHGTQVKIFEIYPDVLDGLKPATLASYLQNRYGDQIGEGFQITIIDRITTEGKTTRGGRILGVQPITYMGREILRRTVKFHGRDMEIALHLHTSGSPAGIRIRRQLGGLPETLTLQKLGPPFNEHPWDKVDGFADYPFHEEEYWDTGKTRMKPTKEYRDWLGKLRELEPSVETALDELQREQTDRRHQQYEAWLSSTVYQVMESETAFADYTLGAFKVKKEEERKLKPERQPLIEFIDVHVVNERGQGVKGISVLLITPSGSTHDGVTGIYGKTVFHGTKPNAKGYRVRIQLPQEYREQYKIVGEGEKEVTITPLQPWAECEFTLATGAEEKKPKRKHGQIRIRIHDFGNTYETYRNNIDQFSTV